MWIDTFRLEVLGAFAGSKHYLDEMAATIPGGAERALLRVRREAEQRGWPWEEFDLARQEVEGVFLYHLPRVMMRSFVIYLHSLVEHHLNGVARSVRTRGQLVLDIDEIHGRPIERARIYLTKVAGLDVSTLGEWPNCATWPPSETSWCTTVPRLDATRRCARSSEDWPAAWMG